MTIGSPFDPNPLAPLVDKMIGTAYVNVRTVAKNIEYVKSIAYHMENVYDVSQHLNDLQSIINQFDNIQTVVDNLAILEDVAESVENLDAVIAVNEQLDKLVLLSSNLVTVINAANNIDNINLVANNIETIETVNSIKDDIEILADVAPILEATASAVRMDEKLFVGDGVTEIWTLDRAAGVDENVLVWVGGSIQNTTDYSISGNILTISPAVSTGINIRTLIMTLVSANEVYDAAQEAKDARDEAVAAVVNYPSVVANTILVDNAAGTARENKTFEEIKTLFYIEKSPKQLEFFNSSSTLCGTGNAVVDKNALQAAINSEYVVDIAGLKLQIADTIVVSKIESMLTSSIPFQRNASGLAYRSSNIQIIDDELPILFDVREYNSRWSNFRIRANPTNTTTTFFQFTRTNNLNDIDVDIRRCSFEYGARHVLTYGRGLQFNDSAVVGASDASIVLDWNVSAVENGFSNDKPFRAERAYTITQLRQHGCRALVRNTGSFKKRISDILISDVQGDTGGCVFEGVLRNSLINNVQSHYHPVAQVQIDLHGGSQNSRINNFMFTGFIDADNPANSRTPTTSIWMRPLQGVGNGITGISFSSGVVGATKSFAVGINGGGVVDVSFNDVEFIDNSYLTNNTVIVMSQPGSGDQFIEDFNITLNNVRFRQTVVPTNAKSAIVSGTSTTLSKVYSNHLTRQVGFGSAIPWTSGSIQYLTS